MTRPYLLVTPTHEDAAREALGAELREIMALGIAADRAAWRYRLALTLCGLSLAAAMLLATAIAFGVV